ncbi:MAG: threonine/serine dehydratase [Rhodobacteraceae bacterium]|jgi:threonine dehydratase|nr:threonine/serine dehydratase [Paracoccaceae bacterium]
MKPDFSLIEQAQLRLGSFVRKTPMLHAEPLDLIAGRRVFVKAECLQITGAFKIRGALSAISKLSEDARRKGVVTCSSGNHAQGLAYAARAHGVQAIIFMPSNAPSAKLEQTRAYGADVRLFDRATQFGDPMAEAFAKENNLTMVPAFNDPYVIAGQGSVGLELADQIHDQNVNASEVLTCCGGGGLTSGIALALEERAPHLTCRTVEPKGFDDTARSLAAGAIKSNTQTDGSICDAVLSKHPGDLTFSVMQRLCGEGLVVTDEECLHAMGLAFRHLKIAIEPGGAVALAAALFHGDALDTEDVVVIASGGNVDADLFKQALTI